MNIVWMTPPKVGDTVRVEELSSYKDPPYTPFYAAVLSVDNTAMITVERRGEIWEAYAFEYLTKEQEVANKEYLETTFPDGTPVKIYPVKEQLFKPLAEVKAEQEYYAKLEQQYWEEEIRKCIEDPKYYFAKYIKFINQFTNA